MKTIRGRKIETPQHNNAKRLVFPLALSAIVIIIYARSIGFDFVFDDIEHIRNNPLVYNFQPSDLWQLFSQPWRAVTQISYALTYSFFGFNAAVFHLFNVLIHGLNSVLVFGISRLLAKQWLPPDKVEFFSAAAGMIFALHPLHSEAVAYVWGRSSSLCALFCFSALFLMLIGFTKAEFKKVFCFAGAVVACFLAWKTKEEAITLPIVAAGLAALMGSWRLAAILPSLPFVFVATQWRSLIQLRSVVAENTELVAGGFRPALDPLTYFLTSIKGAVCYYLKLYIMPVGQSADPYLKPVSGLGDLSLLLSIAVLAALITIGFAMRSNRLLVFGLLALLVSPLSSYAVMPLADVVAEHRIYAAGLGFAILAAWILTQLSRYRYIALAAIAAILGFTTLLRIEVWTNSLTLWKDAATKSPELARPHLNLGMAYQAAGADDLAMAEYARALSVNPSLAPVYVNMAGVYFDRNDLAESENALRKAMALSPAMPAPYLNLAQIAMKKGRPQEALSVLNRMPPSASSYLLNLTRGDVFAQLGRYAEAAAEYEEAMRLRPDLKEMAILARERLNRLGKPGSFR
jgi:protein O-mannosyl-transferase